MFFQNLNINADLLTVISTMEEELLLLSFDWFYPSFSLAESPPRDLKITVYKFTTCTNPIIHLFNPPKICIGIVFDFPQDIIMSQENLQTITMQFFFLGGGGVKEVHYGIVQLVNKCFALVLLLQIIFCSCAIEITLLWENGRLAPRAVREWFHIFSWLKEQWEY